MSAKHKISPDQTYAHLHLRMETADYLQLQAAAFQVGMSIKDYVLSRLQLSDSSPTPVSRLDMKNFQKLLKFHADLNRLGNLFKLAIDQEHGDPAEMQKLHDQIQESIALSKVLLNEAVELIGA